MGRAGVTLTITERRIDFADHPAPTRTDIAWLAGLWDGEGSVGLTVSGTTFIVQSQISMTCGATIRRASDLLLGLKVGHTYLLAGETQKAWYKPAHRLYVSQMRNSETIATALRPYSVTKAQNWDLILEWIRSRVESGGGYDAAGRVRRRSTAYTPEQVALAETIRSIHRRTVNPDSARSTKEIPA